MVGLRQILDYRRTYNYTFPLRDKLTYHAGFVVEGNRVILPETLRETILHGAYLGMSKMKALAEERVN